MPDKTIITTPEQLVSRIMDLEIHFLLQKEFISKIGERVLERSGESFDKVYDSVFQKIKAERLHALQIGTESFPKDSEDAVKSLKDELGL